MIPTVKYSAKPKFIRLLNGDFEEEFKNDVLVGLTSFPKFLLPKYFYDCTGSLLFEKICETPEYYVTRTESSILKKYSDEIAEINSAQKIIVELGSGSSMKTRYLLNSFSKINDFITYIPIDVSEIVIESCERLNEKFPKVKISGIVAEYTQGLNFIFGKINEPKLIIFLGSSIGNFTPSEAKEFLKSIRSAMNENDSLLIGFDMRKDVNVLNAAYNDSQNITAQFNLNILQRINNELGGEFDLNKFEHNAFFNEKESRIEMHLVSKEEHDVCVHSIRKKIYFAKGETIHTENSYKFTDEMINDLSQSAGLKLRNKWSDEKKYFQLVSSRSKKNCN